jgi:hypothetical protein
MNTRQRKSKHYCQLCISTAKLVAECESWWQSWWGLAKLMAERESWRQSWWPNVKAGGKAGGRT